MPVSQPDRTTVVLTEPATALARRRKGLSLYRVVFSSSPKAHIPAVPCSERAAIGKIRSSCPSGEMMRRCKVNHCMFPWDQVLHERKCVESFYISYLSRSMAGLPPNVSHARDKRRNGYSQFGVAQAEVRGTTCFGFVGVKHVSSHVIGQCHLIVPPSINFMRQ